MAVCLLLGALKVLGLGRALMSFGRIGGWFGGWKCEVDVGRGWKPCWAKTFWVKAAWIQEKTTPTRNPREPSGLDRFLSSNLQSWRIMLSGVYHGVILPFADLKHLNKLNVEGLEVDTLELIRSFSPNRFTCEGFLFLWKGCMLRPHDFTFVSGLSFPHDFAIVSQYTLGSLAAWFHICLPLVSACLSIHSGFSGRMISHLSPTCLRLSPTSLWILWPHDFTLFCHLSPPCLPLHFGYSGRMISHLSPSCLPLVSHYILGSVAAWFHICLPLLSACLPLHSRYSGRMISHLSPTCLRLSPITLWMLWPHDFTFVSHLSPLVSH